MELAHHRAAALHYDVLPRLRLIELPQINVAGTYKHCIQQSLTTPDPTLVFPL